MTKKDKQLRSHRDDGNKDNNAVTAEKQQKQQQIPFGDDNKKG
jgi:hypothetical protein